MNNESNIIKIGTKEFSSKEEAYEFCNNVEELNNMKAFLDIKKQKIKTDIKVDQQGRLVLEEGTYIHGIEFDENNLINIKNEGLVAPEFRTNIGDTIYMRSLCVFEVNKNQSLRQYYNKYSNLSRENFDEGTGCGKSYYNGVGVALAEEARYLPIENSKDKIAFIINPNEYTKKFKKDKLNKGLPNEYNRGYEIPIGLPSNLISGIMITRKLVNDKQKIAKLKQIFPDKYIVTPDGDIINKLQKDMEFER